MWKIFLFIESWILYPIYFTICFAVYYILYIIFMFELPKINFIEEFKGNSGQDGISIAAHVLGVYMTGLAILLYIMCKYFLK